MKLPLGVYRFGHKVCHSAAALFPFSSTAKAMRQKQRPNSEAPADPEFVRVLDELAHAAFQRRPIGSS